MAKKGKKAPMDHATCIGNKGSAPATMSHDTVTSRSQTKAPAHSLAKRKAGHAQGTF